MEGEIITVDVDFKIKQPLHVKVMKLLKLVSDALRQSEKVYIRQSSSGKGVHVKVVGGDSALRWIFDDGTRLKATEMRKSEGLRVHTLLFDVKNGKRTGEWMEIKDFKDAERFIREFFKMDF